MQKLLLFLTFGLITFACGHTDRKQIDKIDSSATKSKHSPPNKKVNWYDELIVNYIKKADNELIKLSRKDTGVKIEWLLDRIENTDTAK